MAERGISSPREVEAVSLTSQCEGPSPKSCLKPNCRGHILTFHRAIKQEFSRKSLSDRQCLVELLRPGNDFLGLLSESTAHILKTKLNLHIGKL